MVRRVGVTRTSRAIYSAVHRYRLTRPLAAAYISELVFSTRSEEGSSMRKVFAGLMAAAFVIALAAPAFAATQTVQGQVIDRECYLHDTTNNKGDDHKMGPKD